MRREKMTFITDNSQLSSVHEAVCESSLSPIGLPQLQSIAPPTREVAAYVAAATADATRRAYRDDLSDFERYGGNIPTSPNFLAGYLAFRAESCCPHTIARRLVGIGRAHTSQGFTDPGKSDLVRAVLRGIRRKHGKAQRRAVPLTVEDLLMSLPAGTGVRAVRDRALLLLGFASAMRRSELVSLDATDLTLGREGLTVNLKRSKTDVLAVGRLIAVPYGRSSRACPVLSVQAWQAAIQSPSGPLFRPVDKAGRIANSRLSAGTVNSVIKQAVRAAGLDPAGYSGHSLRAGLITSAAHAGVSLHKIMEQSGHRSVQTLTRYIRDARLFDGNAAAAVL